MHRDTFLILGEKIVCRDLKTGKALWSAKPPGYTKNNTLAVRAGAYLIFRNANELVAIDPDTGTVAGSINTGLASITSISAAGRMIFVGSTTGKLMCFKVVPGGK